MAKMFGILMIVALIWVGLTIYTEGTDRAFGGFFARFSQESVRDAAGRAIPRSPLERLRAAGEGARDRQMSRIERQLLDVEQPEE